MFFQESARESAYFGSQRKSAGAILDDAAITNTSRHVVSI